MHLSIASRNKPYSHTPGIPTLLPGSTLEVRAYPSRLCIIDLAEQSIDSDLSLNIVAPCQEFTVQQDLEKGLIRVWGKSANGFFRYTVSPLRDIKGVLITIEKAPAKGIKIQDASLKPLSIQKGDETTQEKNPFLHPHDQILITATTSDLLPQQLPKKAKKIERLSLGSHKSQDWDLLHRRGDLKEILPLWLQLGQMTPSTHQSINALDSASLLGECFRVMVTRQHEELEQAFLNVFTAGFQGILSPRLHDEMHHGFALAPFSSSPEKNPLQLLKAGATLIKRLFLHRNGNRVEILPLLPPSLHCGRYIGIREKNFGTLEIEWSKKVIRRLNYLPEKSSEVAFIFHKGIKSFRLRHNKKDRGRICKVDEMLQCKQGKWIYLDNFTK